MKGWREGTPNTAQFEKTFGFSTLCPKRERILYLDRPNPSGARLK